MRLISRAILGNNEKCLAYTTTSELSKIPAPRKQKAQQWWIVVVVFILKG
jgi:hypothetical protein